MFGKKPGSGLTVLAKFSQVSASLTPFVWWQIIAINISWQQT